MPSPSRTRQISLTAILIGTSLIAVPFHIRPDNFIVDDGYFYPQIARHIVHGEGSTFNGITLTNGYHPLWMVFCVASAWITTKSTYLIQILTLVQDIFLLGCIAVVVNIARAEKLRGAAFGCIPLVFFGMVLGIWRLLEANLALALQLSVLILVIPFFSRLDQRLGHWKRPVTGVMLGLTMLARLDLLFFALTVLTYDLFFNRKGSPNGKHLMQWFMQSIICAVVVMPYLAWNWITFHHLLPISGAIKSTFPHVQRFGIATFMYPVVAAIVLNLSLFAKKNRSNFDTACILTAIAAALHIAYTVSFGGMAPWYLTTGYLSLSFTLVWIADLIEERLLSWIYLEYLAFSVIFIIFSLLTTLRLISNFTYTRLRLGQVSFRRDYVEPKRALAERLKKTLSPNTRIMIFDAPGGVAFYSGMSVLPIDGLVADYAYNTNIVRDTISGYAAKEHIDYIIAPYVIGERQYNRLFMRASPTRTGQVMEIQAPLTKQESGAIEVDNTDLLFEFQQINPDMELSFPKIGVWRIPHGQASR